MNQSQETPLQERVFVQIKQSKFDNQARQYREYRTILAEEYKLRRTVESFEYMKKPNIPEFYRYQWVLDGKEYEMNCLSPDVFDDCEAKLN